MPAIWLLCVAALALIVAVLVLVARRTHDEMDDTVRSFDHFREALTPRVSALGTDSDELRARVDRGPRNPRR